MRQWVNPGYREGKVWVILVSKPQTCGCVDGNGPTRFFVQRKIAIVARLLRGEPLDLVARQTNVSIARLTEWRDRALAGAATALKECERDDRDDEIARLKSKCSTSALPAPRSCRQFNQIARLIRFLLASSMPSLRAGRR